MKLKAFHKLSYGMYLVASEFQGKRAGYVANTVFQVTAEPAQLAISCHKNNHTAQVIIESGIFSVSVLKKEVNMKIIGDFGFMSSTDFNKFNGIHTMTSKTGAPIVLDSSIAWFDCKVVRTDDLGSHYLIVGEVLDADEISEEEPLTYQWYREKFKMFSPRNSPTFIEKSVLDAEIVKNAKEDAPLKQKDESYVCLICGFTYNPEEGDPSLGISPGTSFEDLPDDYKCPVCNAGKEYFKKG